MLKKKKKDSTKGIVELSPLHLPPWSVPPADEPADLAGDLFLFTLFRRRPLNRSQVLRELFPVFTQLPFPKDASLHKCFLIHPEPVVGSKVRHAVRTQVLFSPFDGGLLCMWTQRVS